MIENDAETNRGTLDRSRDRNGQNKEGTAKATCVEEKGGSYISGNEKGTENVEASSGEVDSPGREGENDFHRGRLREEKSSRARNGWLKGQKDEGMEECELSWQKFADGDGGRSKFKKVEKPIFQRRRPRWVAL